VGLAEADAFACICELARANPLGININIPVREVLTVCGRDGGTIPACA
jgi:hypothetical protein